MYICICKGITDKQVKDAVRTRKGQNAKDIMKSLGVGSDCGTCLEDAINNMISESSKPPFELKDICSVIKK